MIREVFRMRRSDIDLPDVEGLGFSISVSEVQLVARRQLVGSVVVVAIFAFAFAAIAAVHPTVRDVSHLSLRPAVQQPILVTPSRQLAFGSKLKVGTP
jgi:hypothetical protein